MKPFPPRTANTMSEAIAIDSPNGRMSKRAHDAACKRLAESLFGHGGLTREQAMGGPTEQPKESVSLRRHAAMLRDLAAKGMHPRKYAKEAAKAEQRAAELEAQGL